MVAGAAPAALADASNGPRSQGSIIKGAGDGPAEAARERAAAPGSPAKGSPAKVGSPRRGSCTLRELCAEDKVSVGPASLAPPLPSPGQNITPA